MSTTITTAQEINASVKELDESTLEAVITTVKELEREIADKQAMVDNLKSKIKDAMRTEGVEKMRAGIFSLTCKEVVMSRFDSKLFKEENKELYEHYTTQSTQIRLTIR